jgi:hypothetical protein
VAGFASLVPEAAVSENKSRSDMLIWVLSVRTKKTPP